MTDTVANIVLEALFVQGLYSLKEKSQRLHPLKLSSRGPDRIQKMSGLDHNFFFFLIGACLGPKIKS